MPVVDTLQDWELEELEESWSQVVAGSPAGAEAPLTAAELERVERELGRKLPASYAQVMAIRNGGEPAMSVFPRWATTDDLTRHVRVDELFGVGSTSPCSLLGERGVGSGRRRGSTRRGGW